MDEREYLKRKKIRKERMFWSLVTFVAGVIIVVLGCVCLSLYYESVLTIAIFTVLIFLGRWAKSKVKDLKIKEKDLKIKELKNELEVYDKEREHRKAQRPVSPAAVGSSGQLQYCPSCSKKLQADWKVCGHCGKRLGKE